jgi:hypothetical protein
VHSQHRFRRNKEISFRGSVRCGRRGFVTLAYNPFSYVISWAFSHFLSIFT